MIVKMCDYPVNLSMKSKYLTNQ